MDLDNILNIVILLLILYLFMQIKGTDQEGFINYKIPSDKEIQKEIEHFINEEGEILNLDDTILDKDLSNIQTENKVYKNNIIPKNKRNINEVELPFRKGKSTIKKHEGCKYNSYLAKDYIRNNLLGEKKECDEECLKKKKESDDLLASQTNFKDLINTDSNQMSIINHMNNISNISKNKFTTNERIMDVYDKCTLNSTNPSTNNENNILKYNFNNNEKNYFLL